MRPGLLLMRQLGFARKLGLLALVLLLPLGGLMIYTVTHLQQDLQTTRSERAGSEVVSATLEVVLLT